MNLNETISLMTSDDYQERFKAEYFQLKIRHDRLKQMVEKWNAGDLAFQPTCPKSTYTLQLRAMEDYLAILEARALMEEISLNTIDK